MIREIKWAYQRVVRGYDDRIYWGMDEYFSQFIPAIKKFCENELECYDKYLNEDRFKVYKETLKLIKKVDKSTCKNIDKNILSFWKYFGENIGYYWN